MGLIQGCMLASSAESRILVGDTFSVCPIHTTCEAILTLDLVLRLPKKYGHANQANQKLFAYLCINACMFFYRFKAICFDIHESLPTAVVLKIHCYKGTATLQCSSLIKEGDYIGILSADNA